jgi:hypothetical protein
MTMKLKIKLHLKGRIFDFIRPLVNIIKLFSLSLAVDKQECFSLMHSLLSQMKGPWPQRLTLEYHDKLAIDKHSSLF